ncbi:hypothetical protein JW935_06735 [candidate division KSB1 bacterium]|nr:hypothetical protein [candidate division KSB1 bacterium]
MYRIFSVLLVVALVKGCSIEIPVFKAGAPSAGIVRTETKKRCVLHRDYDDNIHIPQNTLGDAL